MDNHNQDNGLHWPEAPQSEMPPQTSKGSHFIPLNTASFLTNDTDVTPLHEYFPKNKCWIVTPPQSDFMRASPQSYCAWSADDVSTEVDSALRMSSEQRFGKLSSVHTAAPSFRTPPMLHTLSATIVAESSRVSPAGGKSARKVHFHSSKAAEFVDQD
jgi:hypothetical protein